ncbi:hypothetical protein AB8Z38_02345 [Bradyrhizobium sp. LLZ17]|uniref:Uncharacterized protein n=1 Tax=Bradyrhizobium sp. LLZ17 TaxID=3239388 RepID=A0AB39XKE6_9BRAD
MRYRNDKGTRVRPVIDKQPERTRCPNLADAVVMYCWPVDELAYDTGTTALLR